MTVNAIQKSNLSVWMDYRTRADRLVDRLNELVIDNRPRGLASDELPPPPTS